MKNKLLYILVFMAHLGNSQNLSRTIDWKHGHSTTDTVKNKMSFWLTASSMFGTTDIVSVRGAARFATDSERAISTISLQLTPIEALNIYELEFSISQQVSRIFRIHAGYTLVNTRFTSEAENVMGHLFQLSGMVEMGKIRLAPSLMARKSTHYDISTTTLHGSIVYQYKAGEKMSLAGQISSQALRGHSFIEQEVNHHPNRKWSYGVCFGMPTPYFGIRFSWKMGALWDIDIQSRRHPFLGNSYISQIIYGFH